MKLTLHVLLQRLRLQKQIEQVVHRGMVRIACITKRSITAGEQLLVDYGAAYWKQAGVEPVQLATRAAPTAISPGETNPDPDQPGCANK